MMCREVGGRRAELGIVTAAYAGRAEASSGEITTASAPACP